MNIPNTSCATLVVFSQIHYLVLHFECKIAEYFASPRFVLFVYSDMDLSVRTVGKYAVFKYSFHPNCHNEK